MVVVVVVVVQILSTSGIIRFGGHDVFYLALFRFQYALRSTDSSERHLTARGRATQPCLPRAATLGVPGEGRGAAVQLGERGAWKVERSPPGDGLLGPRESGGSYKTEIPVR